MGVARIGGAEAAAATSWLFATLLEVAGLPTYVVVTLGLTGPAALAWRTYLNYRLACKAFGLLQPIRSDHASTFMATITGRHVPDHGTSRPAGPADPDEDEVDEVDAETIETTGPDPPSAHGTYTQQA